VPLPVPGSADLPGIGLSIAASVAESATPEDIGSGHRDRVVVQGTALAMPLVVRSRQAGDRFRPLGAPGRRKLQDVLVDRKVPRQDRDRVPIVVDAAGRIVWVVGVTIAEECRVTAPATGVVVLKVLRKDLT
jgi:tRNA(Ile)-lysidine synthase